MSSQRERSLENLLNETRGLKERVRQSLASHVVFLKELSSLPGEFVRRFWASRLEALVETVKRDYETFQARAQKADFLSRFMTLGIDVVLKAGGMQPIAPPSTPELGLAISPLGKITPDWRDNPGREPAAIFVTREQFTSITLKLKEKLSEGAIVPASEAEISELIFREASAKP
jgi:hypothetical protein